MKPNAIEPKPSLGDRGVQMFKYSYVLHMVWLGQGYGGLLCMNMCLRVLTSTCVNMHKLNCKA